MSRSTLNRCLLLLAVTLLPLAASPAPPAEDSPGISFERIGPFGGDVRSLLVSAARPEVAYLGTSDGRIFKSVDGGSSWTPLVPGIGRRHYVIDTLVQHPRNPDHVFAGAWDLRSNGGGLFESLDAGLSWSPVALPQGSLAVRDFAISGGQPDHRIVGTLAGAFVSSDAGRTWTRAMHRPGGISNVESVAIDPRDPRFLFAGTRRLGYRSADHGRSWRLVDEGMPLDSHIFSVFIDPASPETVFASACSGMYRSSDRAASWTRLRVIPERFAIRAQRVVIDPVNPRRVYAGTTQGLFISEDRGQSWRLATGGDVTVNAIQVHPREGQRILLGTQNLGVLRSDDGGRTWRESNRGFVHRKISRLLPDPVEPQRLITGLLSDGPDGGFHVFDPRDKRWAALTHALAPRAEIYCLLSLPGRGGRLAGTAGGVYVQRAPSGPWTRLGGRIEKLVVQDLVHDTREGWIYAATSDGVYRARPESLDFQRPIGARLAPRVSSVIVSRHRAGRVLAATSLGVLFSPDHGATWQDRSWGLPSRSVVQSLAECPVEEGHLFAGTLRGLFESRDGGESWQRTSEDGLGVEVSSVVFLDSSGEGVLAADSTFGGVYYSRDGGRQWERIESSGYDSPVRTIALDRSDHSRVYLGTSTDGVYALRLAGAAAQSSP